MKKSIKLKVFFQDLWKILLHHQRHKQKQINMSTPALKRKIDMSKQTCNYCKGLGHRIHAMDALGVYLVGADGERVLACPVLVEKETFKEKRATKAEDEFPALPGQKGVAASAATLALPSAISAAEKDRKQREWLVAKELKEQKMREWTERHIKRMEQKYGDKWHEEVKGKEGEDCDYAREKREMEEQMREDVFEQEEREAFEAWEAKRAARAEARSSMTREDAMQDEEDEEDEMDCDLEAAKLEHEFYSSRREREMHARAQKG